MVAKRCLREKLVVHHISKRYDSDFDLFMNQII
jgi:hypothetical protein